MLIVLEGCDGSGKTTIANQLKNLLDAEIVHCTTDTTNDFDFFYKLIEASEHRNIIADRFCYGQFVYQNPKDRKLDRADLEALETEMIRSGAKVVYVTAPVIVIENRLLSRREKPTMPVCEILDRYLDLFENKTLIKPQTWWTGFND